jgi:molybdate transport system substrate-binding protein
VVAGSRTDLVRSGVAVAVRAGRRGPTCSSEAALRAAVLSKRAARLFDRAQRRGAGRAVRALGHCRGDSPRIVLASPGVPVGRLVAEGEVELGFQQYSELMHLPGIDILGAMPAGCEIVTTFSAALCAASTRPEAVRSLLAFLSSPAAVDAKRRNGMEPV